MRLTLSSTAAPDATLSDLVDACRRKGLDGLELVQGEGHGVMPAAASRSAPDIAPNAGVVLTGFRLADAGELPAALDGARGAPTPLLVPVETATELAGVLQVAERGGGGGRLVVSSADIEVLAQAVLADQRVGVAWDFVPGAGDPDDVETLLDRAGRRLRHVRLFGGGPETASQGGTGVGKLMARLARAAYAGALVITPSSPRYRVAWSTWLGRRGGWGCSGKATPSEPIVLQRTSA